MSLVVQGDTSSIRLTLDERMGLMGFKMKVLLPSELEELSRRDMKFVIKGSDGGYLKTSVMNW